MYATDEPYERDGIWWHDGEPYPGPDEPAPYHVILAQWARRFGKTAQQQQYASKMQGAHIHISVLDEFSAGLQKIADAITTLPKKSDFVESNPETPRDRALRLKRQPHSMSDRNGYDRKGRKR